MKQRWHLAGGDPDRISRTHFAQWLVETGAVSSMQGAFDKYLGNGKSGRCAYALARLCHRQVSLIRDAGGTAVLAHPGRYPLTRTKLRTVNRPVQGGGGEALEVATATEKPDVVRYLGQLCTQFDLEASQGSDFHGPHIPWIQLGRFLNCLPNAGPVWRRWIPEGASSMSQYFYVHPDNPQSRLIKQAASMVREGAVIAYPTDSAYALGMPYWRQGSDGAHCPPSRAG
jgi:hypothetical protein